ncbi:MAG: tRNA uridine-5-carboxymethylaminomethyl(34) synthesis GTPase MnmE [Alphaproteobacteria bacterium]|nr:tRNA uridine-5-carboxymethylaminomethyl(34) synthesis GTPase MnmE [Alphaproteobacteria bacterium]
MDDATIYAFATAPGRAGVALLRLSGPHAAAALRALAGRLPTPRRALVTRFSDPRNGELIDRGIALYFPAPHSLTGEDVAEIHVHGGRAVAAALLEALAAQPGLRLAEPGEFSRRAFLNGKLDLTEAEGIADLVAAETAAQRRQALRQMAGEAGRLYEGWRARLLRAQARVEAEIDFPDEGLPADLAAAVATQLSEIKGEITTFLADNHRGERLRDGLAIAVLGPPNAGKSSLVNALARRDVAITAATAGTTRDVIEVALDLAGFPVTLADTAGLRDSSDAIEEEGVRRARARAASADLKLVVVDATKPEEKNSLMAMIDSDTVVVANKMDLAPRGDAAWTDALGATPAVKISVTTGAGMAMLEARLGTEIARRFGGESAPLITRARHRQALEVACAALGRYPRAGAAELAAEELRQAVRALGRITGRVGVEDLLDVVFREFCIGK